MLLGEFVNTPALRTGLGGIISRQVVLPGWPASALLKSQRNKAARSLCPATDEAEVVILGVEQNSSCTTVIPLIAALHSLACLRRSFSFWSAVAARSDWCWRRWGDAAADGEEDESPV